MEGRIVHHYRIENKLGAGGMGIVYKALDTKLKRTVALKFLPLGVMTEESHRQRFLREATAASSLDHPNICTIYEINETNEGQLFMAMAYYPGETLAAQVRRGPLPLDRALDLAIQLGRGLEYAHKRGVTHRDIKPANLMLHEGTLKVLDFGLAKLAGEAGLTQEGSTVGTLHYMSPEQAQGHDIDHRTDIWSAGAVLYEMLTGSPPFTGSTRQAILTGILAGSVPSAASRDPSLPPEIDWIISKAMAKQLGNRYPQIADMLADVAALRREEKPTHATGRSVVMPASLPAMAVLPFENLSSDKENEYFSDGLTEDLIDALSRLPGLRMVSRTSAFQFKGKAQDVREIGRVLKVDSVLEGSVRRAGNRLRITVQLTDVATGYHRWSQRYDRQLDDIFAVQDEISDAIVNALRVTLSVSHVPEARVHPRSVEAYQLYLKGRFHWNKKTPDGLEKAREFFEKALEEDPGYALAYAGLAQYHNVRAIYWLAPPAETWPKAKAAALRAIELDPNLPDPYTVSGAIRGFYEHDWAAAERDLEKAVDLRPNFVEGLLAHCYYFMATARLDKALEAAKKALESDPLSQGANAAEAMVLLYSGRYDAAIQRCKEALDLDPNFIEFYYTLGLAYQAKEQFPEAIAAFERGAETSRRMPLILGWQSACYAAAGRTEDAQRILDELLQIAEKGFPVPLPLAVAYTGLGDKDRAFEWLDRAVDSYDFLLGYIQVVPTYDSLRDDPRYLRLLGRLGLLPFTDTATMSLGPIQ